MTEKQVVKTTALLYRAQENGKVELIGSKCKRCGHEMFPVQEQCSNCLHKELEEFSFPTEGVLYSYSTVVAAPAGFEGPYSVGYVDIGGMRVFGRIKGDEPKIGDKVKVVESVLRQSEDTIYKGYMFELEKEEQ